MNDIGQSLECLDHALEIDPSSEEAWFWRGVALVQEEDLETAMDCFETAVEHDPDHAMSWIMMARVENFQKGLKPTVEKLEVVPAVVFDDVAESDAKRIVSNLIHLGCSAKYEHRKQE